MSGDLPIFSFNPCFRGTRSRTAGAIVSSIPEVRCVSILVFVELALGLHGRVEAFRTARCMFQSLFSWNSLSDDVPKRVKRDAGNVSILVFVELALGL